MIRNDEVVQAQCRTCHGQPMDRNAGGGHRWRCVIGRRWELRCLAGTASLTRDLRVSRCQYSVAGLPQRYTFRRAETRDRAAAILRTLVDELCEKERRERENFDAAL